MGPAYTLAGEALRRFVAATLETIRATRKNSPGGKKITRAERRLIARALLPELERLVELLANDLGEAAETPKPADP